MKVLLDECVPWPMNKLLGDHECTTAQKRGWGGVTNGELLKLAETEFDLDGSFGPNPRQSFIPTLNTPSWWKVRAGA